MAKQLRPKRRVGKPPKRLPSPADEADALAVDRAVERMIQDVLSKWDITRPVASLNKADLRNLAEAAITGWVLQRAENEACARREAEQNQTSDVGFADVL